MPDLRDYPSQPARYHIGHTMCGSSTGRPFVIEAEKPSGNILRTMVATVISPLCPPDTAGRFAQESYDTVFYDTITETGRVSATHSGALSGADWQALQCLFTQHEVTHQVPSTLSEPSKPASLAGSQTRSEEAQNDPINGRYDLANVYWGETEEDDEEYMDTLQAWNMKGNAS